MAVQEYTEEFRDITKGAKSKESLPVAPITLIHQRPVGDDLHVRTVVFIDLILYFEFFAFHFIFWGSNKMLWGNILTVIRSLDSMEKGDASWDGGETVEETARVVQQQPRKKRTLGLRKLSDLSNMLSLY